MPEHKQHKRLSSVLMADIVGYTKLVEKDTEATVNAWNSARKNVIDPTVEEYSGRIVKLTGDGFLAEFSSVQDSVLCAIAIQERVVDNPLTFRMGVNLGDVVDDEEDIHGEGVNIAARIEALAEPGSITIAGGVFEQVRNRISANFKDMGEHAVKHVSAPVRVYQIEVSIFEELETSSEPEISDSIGGGDAKPRLMLLPFRNLNQSEDNDFLVDGIVDDIITEISMINSIEIMSRNTTFDYKDNPIAVKEAAEKYKLDYVIFGSIRSAGARVRISAELGDPISGDAIWSERYDRTMDDVFEIQDEIVKKITGTVLSEIEVSSLQRAKRKPTEKMTSYEFLLQGKFHKRKLTKDDANIAIAMFSNAIESDPSNGRAYAERCCTWADGLGQNWYKESDDELKEKIRTTLKEAYELTGHDWDCHRLLCNVSLFLDLNYDKAEEHGKRAYELNPNAPPVLSSYGKALVHNGKFELGVKLLRKAQELDPHSQQLIDDVVWGSYHVGDYATCIEFSEQIRRLRPNTWILKIASLGALGQKDKRNEERQRFVEKFGDDSLDAYLGNLNVHDVSLRESTRSYVAH